MPSNIDEITINSNQTEKMAEAEELSKKTTINLIQGNTTYFINLHFASKGRETFADKAKRLIAKEIKAGDF